jgi:hypothetical protein
MRRYYSILALIVGLGLILTFSLYAQNNHDKRFEIKATGRNISQDFYTPEYIDWYQFCQLLQS